MTDRSLQAVVLSDFNAANFAAALVRDESFPHVEASAGSYGNIHDASASLETGGTQTDLAVVWTRPDAVSAHFSALLDRGEAALAGVLGDVDQFAGQLARIRERCSRLVVMTWAVPPLSAAFGALAMKEGVGIANVLMRMNLRLAERIEEMPGVILLDASRWIDEVRAPEEAKLWYAAKIPFRHEVFRRAARQVKSACRASLGGSRKLIVLDLDDTLWGGLVGEVGWTSLRIGGHDPGGEAFADFQRTLCALSQRGVLLGIASKNDERVALEAIESHPEMVLRRRNFAGWRINWDDKAANILALTTELNLGLNAVVFIDDSAAERARVRETLPDVLVPEWPSSPLRYVDALLALDCFDTVSLTEEDRDRSQQYAAERARATDRESTSMEDWLRRLELRIDVEELNDRNRPRAVQLLNKTNQMNLTTRRLDEGELTAWLREGRRTFWTFRVSDRFGDAGLTGLASVQYEGRRAALVDFVLSCRVFGRKVEEAMLHLVTQSARQRGAKELVATFVPTAKNAPCQRFLQASGLEQRTPDQFWWNLEIPYPLPAAVELRQEMELSS